MTPLDAVATAAEAVAWLALPLGFVLLAGAVGRRSWSRRYRRMKGVIAVADGPLVTVRWFSDGGAVQEAVTHLDEGTPQVGDAQTVWVHPSRPESMRLDDPAHDGRVLVTVGAILTAVGVIATVVSFVLPLL